MDCNSGSGENAGQRGVERVGIDAHQHAAGFPRTV
jgi:hypothetical protein